MVQMEAIKRDFAMQHAVFVVFAQATLSFPAYDGLSAYFDFFNHGWVGEGTSYLNGYFFPEPPVKPDVIVSHHPAFSVLPR